MNILLIFLSALVVSSHSRPQDTRVIFPDEFEQIAENLVENELLPGPNGTAEVNTRMDAIESLENRELYQGDMRLTTEQEKFYAQNDTSDEEDEIGTRTGRINSLYRWPKYNDGNVYVPYKFDFFSGFSNYEKTRIKASMENIAKYTCIRFFPRTHQVDYLNFISDSGCWSSVGMIDGEQDISLKRGSCFQYGTILHEIIHALGFDHMQSHADRDKYIAVLWENIKDADRHNFDRVDPKKYSNFGTTYDYWSVMHYKPNLFSKNGEDTIKPKDTRYRNIIGSRNQMSSGDVQRINNMYNCKK